MRLARALRLFGIAATAACSAPLEPLPDLAPDPAPGPSLVVEGPAPHASASTSAKLGQAPKGGGFKLPSGFSATELACEGDDLYFVPRDFHDEAQIGRVSRSGEQVLQRGPSQVAHLRVLGAGTSRQALAVGAAGGVARYVGGSWQYQLAPALDGEPIGAAVIGPDGALYAAGEQHALYVASGDTWTIHRYGSLGTAVMDAAIAKDGTVYLVGRHGRVLSFDGQRFNDVSIQGLTASGLAHKWVASWLDEKRTAVWIAASKMLIHIDLLAKKANMLNSPMFFDLQAISGVETAKGPLLILGTFGATALFDGTGFFGVDDTGADGIAIDLKRAQAYVAHGSVRAVDLAHPWLGTGPAKPLTH